MKRKADRIDKMNKTRVSSCGFPEILTLARWFCTQVDLVNELLGEEV